jgi:hypothetical protein
MTKKKKAKKIPKHEVGPFGEAIFPGAEEDLTMDAMRRYRTKEPFEEIARFYDAVYGGQLRVRVGRAAAHDHPCFTVGVSADLSEPGFTSLVVMVDPASLRKRKPLWHILVTKR